MIRYLIKNNIKLMSRSFINIMAIIICPLLVSAILTSAFSSLMEKYEGSDGFTVGYRYTGASDSELMKESLKNMGSENGIKFVEYTEGEAEEILTSAELACFIEFVDDSFIIYEKEEALTEGKILEGAMSIFYGYATDMQAAMSTKTYEITVSDADYIPPVDSKDYYGIIEIVYFGWCAIVCAAGLFSNEKKYRIRNRFSISGVSEVKLYIARLLSLGIVVGGGVGISAVLSALLFQVHWGNVLLSAIIVFFMVMASSAFGLMLYSLTDSMVLTIIIVFSVVWICGFFGGSFETYMFSSASQTLKNLSPIYHENRALIELLVQGKSDYIISALLYPAGILAVCSAISVAAGKLRSRR